MKQTAGRQRNSESLQCSFPSSHNALQSPNTIGPVFLRTAVNRQRLETQSTGDELRVLLLIPQPACLRSLSRFSAHACSSETPKSLIAAVALLDCSEEMCEVQCAPGFFLTYRIGKCRQTGSLHAGKSASVWVLRLHQQIFIGSVSRFEAIIRFPQ
jgi:hypothetical protein